MDPSAGAWIGELVEDNRATVPDQVAAKIDVAVWLSSLPRLRQQIARDLALGGATQDVARTYGLTAGRISQLRRWFEKSWADFHGETATVSA
jgi:hypothetical protein